ncbi:MAG: winged helix-turn-helix transcriptional regulator [Deltaproteobacteria bacterium]|nr:winged helix-turn-helix transcriptional regulator [Deltaproteobacteria bacterium]
MTGSNAVSDPRPAVDDTCEVFAFDEDRVRQAMGALPSDDVSHLVAETLKTVAHPTRIRILRALGPGELCVCDLAQVLGISVSAVSHQLRLLRQNGLVSFRSQGKMAYYRLVDHDLLAFLEICIQNASPTKEAGS